MALPDDGRRDLGDNITIGNAISALMSPAFVDASFSYNLVNNQTCPGDTNVIKFRKSGSLIAEAVTEGAVYTASDANSLLTDASVTATATKIASGAAFSHEAERFGGGQTGVSRIAAEQGAALARKYDDDFLALFDSIANAATASTVLDTDTFLLAKYYVNAAKCPPARQVAVIDYKGALELQKFISNSGAAIYTSQYSHPILGTPKSNGYIGTLFETDIYQTSGLSTTGSDDQGLVFNPLYAFGAAVGGQLYSHVMDTGPGVASQIPGMSKYVISWMYWNIIVWNNAAACELRSDT